VPQNYELVSKFVKVMPRTLWPFFRTRCAYFTSLSHALNLLLMNEFRLSSVSSTECPLIITRFMLMLVSVGGYEHKHICSVVNSEIVNTI